jgi:hypothetical protein
MFSNAVEMLAAEGRGSDSTLVHMSPQEVRGLQALAMAHGGSLTVNPSTGLPEAGFLSNILPVIGGAAMTAMGVPPPLAALIMGGGTALATGDMGKGLSAGLGAYGGAGLGAGLMGAGTQAAADAAIAGNLSALGEPALAATNAAQAAQASPFSTMGQGISSVFSPGAAGEAARSGFMSGVGGLKGLGISGLAAAAPMLLSSDSGVAPVAKAPTMNRLTYQPNVTSPFPQSTVPGYGGLGQDFGREQRYFDGRYVNTGIPFTPGVYAAGGPIEAPVQTYPMSYINTSDYATGLQEPTPRMAHGGMSHLGDYSDGGRMLKGPGDGVSDSIPAVIGGRQPARLADGEFVIPARIVSELGNGSSEAGARKLYAMMDRVQSARKKSTGKNQVAANTKAEKMLPA